ncbi:MAG: alpha-2-macroglobulin family protein [Candidatus Odinarchaeota archaeon]
MTKFYTRIPKNLSSKGTIYRLFNATSDKLSIENTSSNEKFAIAGNRSSTKFWTGNNLEPVTWVVKSKEGRDERIKLAPIQFGEEYLGALWLPKNQYRPGDKIKGYVLIRRRLDKGKSLLELCIHDPANPYLLEVLDPSGNTIKAFPFEKPDQPILYFEVEVEKYHPTGKYDLQVKRGKTVICNQFIEIAHYDKPDIQAVVKGASWGLIGDPLELIVDARYYHGEVVDSAKVTISCGDWDKDHEIEIINGTVNTTLPDLSIGDWNLDITIKDQASRHVTTSHKVKIVEEPIVLAFDMSPLERPVVEHQPVRFVLQVTNPVGKPASGVTFECTLVKDQQKEVLPAKRHVTDEHGYITIELPGLIPGEYVFKAKSTGTEISLQVSEAFYVRKSTTEDFWIHIKDIPRVTSPGDTVSGRIVISGGGLSQNACQKVYLDVIADAILDSKELAYKLEDGSSRLTTEIPFTVDIPATYHGEIILEAYLDPVTGSLFRQKKEKLPAKFDGEGFSFPRTATRTKIELKIQQPILKVNLEVPEEVATGTDFMVHASLEEVREDTWLALALTDERVLMDYQPVKMNDVFYEPTGVVEILTVGSRRIEPMIGAGMPLPAMAPAGGPPAGGMFRGIRRAVGGPLLKAKGMQQEAIMMPSADTGGDLLLELKGAIKKETTELVTKSDDRIPALVVRTEFPEDIVLQPEQVTTQEHSVTMKAPDSITTYRLFGIVCTKTHFGITEKEILVRNPVFTATQNPPEMILGDQVAIPTVIENISTKMLENLRIRIQPNKCLELLSEPFFNLGQLNGKDRMTVFWSVEATKVGDAQLTTLLESESFTEYAELQKPLYISPPGVPHPAYYRSSIEAGKKWSQVIEVAGNEAFVLGIVNFMPGIDLAVLEGVESMATYPYGCCEQTSSTVLPNAVAYRYLESKNKLTDELRNTFITNMKAGLDRYTSIFRNPDSGGFGLWDGTSPSVFHTSLAISVIGKIDPFIDVPEEIFKGARSYLASQQNEDGSYEPSSGVHSIFPATLSKLAMTGYVVHSQAVGGIKDEKGIRWLLAPEQSGELKQDATILALVVDIIGMLKSELPAEITVEMENLVKSLLELVETSETGSYWAKGSSLSSEIETTAYALTALAHTGITTSETMELYQTGTNYLLNTRTSSGWFTTRDTLWACLALGEISHQMKTGAVNAAFKVSLNGKHVKTVEITPENRYYRIYDLRNIFLDQFVTGDNIFEVELTGAGAGHLVLETRKWYAEKPRQVAPVEITQQIAEKLIVEKPFTVEYSLHSSETLEAVLLEQPVPAGCEVPDETLDRLREVEGVSHVEINSNKLAIFFDLFNRAELQMSFIPSLTGKIQVDGIRLIPMYSPEITTTTKTTWVEIEK